MKISGFSFARNAQKLYYPVVESIQSILPICDEFVIAVGRGDEDDQTRELITSINDPRIKIIDTDWDGNQGSHVFAQQTDIALQQCSGDWCFYIQCDEAIHEKSLPVIKAKCLEYLNNNDVEGLLFRYLHFWGDYDHFHVNHAWYPREIRVVRNRIGVRSYRDAQSFRIGERKLQVASVDAEVFHYGWVRPPYLMQKKRVEFSGAYIGVKAAQEKFRDAPADFDYGALGRLRVYKGSHPAVMGPRISQHDWKDSLNMGKRSAVRHKHDRFKYRLLTFLEQKVLGGMQLGGFRNYKLVRKQ